MRINMFKNLLKLTILINLCVACSKQPQGQKEDLKVDQKAEVLSSPIEYTEMGVPYYNDATSGKRVELHGEFRVERDNKPELVLNTPSLNFGSIVGDQYTTSKVTVKNVGIKQAEEIKVLASNNFQIINNNCENLTLKTDEVCFFRVYFNAKNKDNISFLEEIVVADKETKVTLPVTATKVVNYDFSLEASNNKISFNEKRDVSTRNVRIINRGPGVADKIKVALTSSEFTVYQNDCEGSSLAVNQYCTISLQFESSKHESKVFSSYLLVSSSRNNKEIQIQLSVNNEKTYLVAEEKLENIKDEEKAASQNPNENKDVSLQLKKMQEDLIKESNLTKKERLAKQEAQAKIELENKRVEEKIKKEKEQLAKKEAEEAARLAKEEEDRLRKNKLAAEEAEKLAKKQAEELAKKQALEEKIKQEQLAKKQAEDKLRAEQLEKKLAELKRKEEIKAQEEAAALAKKEAEAKLKAEQLALAELKNKENIRKQEELKAQQEAAALAKKEAEAKLKAQKEAIALAKKQAEEEKRNAELAEKKRVEEEKIAKQKSEEELQAKLKAQKEEQIKLKMAEEEAIKKEIEDKKIKIAAEKQRILEEKKKKEKDLSEKLFAEKMKINKALAEEKAAKEEALKREIDEKNRLEKEQLAKKEAEEKAIKEAQELALQKEQERIENERLAKLSEQQRINEEISRQQALLLEQQALAEEKKKIELERLSLEKEKEQAKIAADNYRIQSELKAKQAIEEERIKQEQQLSQQFAYEQQQLAKAQAKAQAELRSQIIQATTTPVTSRQSERVVVTTKAVEQLSSPVSTESASVELEESEDGAVTVSGSGGGNFTPFISLKGNFEFSNKIQMSYNKTMNPHVLRYDKVLTTYKQDLPLFSKPVSMVEGKVLDQKSLVQIIEGKSLSSENVTDLERKIELDLKGGTTSDTCSFSGVFSYIKCVFSSMSLAVKDLINMDKLESIKIYANGQVSNEINLGRTSVSQVHPTLVPSSLTQKNQALFQNEMYFQAKIAENKSKLFKIDYFSISQVSNSNPSGDDSPLRLVVFKGELYYSSLNYLGLSKLFKSDGKKIVQISNIFPEGNDYLVPAIVYNDDLYLEGVNERGFLKLYKTDGKEIIQVSDINPSGSDSPSDFKVYNGELYFRANNMLGHSKLFKISPIGMAQVSDINPSSHDAPEFLEVYNGELYFSAFKEGEGNKLFKFNGEKISQVSNTNIQNDEPSDLKTYQDKLYFVANNKDGRRKLFRLDNEKIEEFSNIRADMSDFAQNFREKKSFLTEYNKELYFVAKNENNAFKIFKTDGKSLYQVSNINEADPAINPSGSDFPFNLMVYNDYLYFSAYGNKVGLKLYRLKSESTEK